MSNEHRVDKVYPEYYEADSVGLGTAALNMFLTGMMVGGALDGNEWDQKWLKNADINGRTLDGHLQNGLRELQRLIGTDQDGCFGPGTRKALYEKTGIDFNHLQYSAFHPRSLAKQPDGTEITWPPHTSID